MTLYGARAAQMMRVVKLGPTTFQGEARPPFEGTELSEGADLVAAAQGAGKHCQWGHASPHVSKASSTVLPRS